MKRGVAGPTFLAALALAASVQAQTPSTTLPFRGNLRARTALSWNYNRQYLQKIFPTLESGLFTVENTRLDWLGMADEGYRFTSDGWLAYRGALASFTDARPQLTALPGYEWLDSSIASQGTARRNLTIYGADHVCPGRSRLPQWPALRVGRLMADMDAEEQGLVILKKAWLRRSIQLTMLDQFYGEALASDLTSVSTPNSPTQYDLGNLRALEKVQFMGTEPPSSDPYQNVSAPGLLYPPLESIWGPPSSELDTSLNLMRGQALAQQLLPAGLDRMGRVAGNLPGFAYQLLETLEDGNLRLGEPRATQGFMEHLPLPPGWRTAKTPEATRDNPQYTRAYGEYYALLETGVNLFQSYGGGGLSQTGLEQARFGWFKGTADQHMVDLNPGSITSWDRMFDWLEVYDPQQTIVAQLSTPDLGGAAPWLRALDPRKLHNKSKARERFGLIEMAYGLQSVADFGGTAATSGGGPYPTNSPAPAASPGAGSTAQGTVQTMLPYYNAALRNGWRVAPVSAVDNLGPLGGHQNRLVPGVRSTFTGLYPGQEQAIINSGQSDVGSSGSERMRQFLQALNQRRTFVSENPYVDALLYARDVTTGRTVLMGGQLFQSENSAPTTFEFTLQLNVPVRNQYTENLRIRVEDIKLVEVVEKEHELDQNGQRLSIVNVTRDPNATIAPGTVSQLLVDESPVFKYYNTGTVAQPGGAAGVPGILQNYGLTGPPLNSADAETYPLPLTLRWRKTLRPHTAGRTIAFYVYAPLPGVGSPSTGSATTNSTAGTAGGMAVTAPLWTVGDWNRFVSSDESL